jgi:catechol 2,3-dioxygenase-like lactoylglutathione lyase family enzyme
MSKPDVENGPAGDQAPGGRTGSRLEFTAKIASSVIFVTDLDRSIEFYRDVFSCEIAIHEQGAALLLTPGGFQLYLMSGSNREAHPTGGIGHEFLTWAVDTPEALEHFAQALRDRGYYVDTHTSGGVQFVESHDPDHIRVVIAHPSPQQLPRSVLDSRFYS